MSWRVARTTSIAESNSQAKTAPTSLVDVGGRPPPVWWWPESDRSRAVEMRTRGGSRDWKPVDPRTRLFWVLRISAFAGARFAVVVDGDEGSKVHKLSNSATLGRSAARQGSCMSGTAVRV